MMNKETTKEEILGITAGFIKEVIGEEYVEDIDIDFDTSFADDLEMESIEVVEFAEKVRDHFGEQVDFAEWLSGMELEEIINLSVGEVVDFIQSCLS